MGNNWMQEHPAKTNVFGVSVEDVNSTWQEFMKLEGYSDQTKRLKSAGFDKFVRWQFGLEKPSKARAPKDTKEEKPKKAEGGKAKKKAEGGKAKRSRPSSKKKTEGPTASEEQAPTESAEESAPQEEST